MNKSAEKGGRDIREVFGKETMASNYQLRKAALDLTPDAISLLMPAKEAIRDAILLEFKFMRLRKGETSLFSLQTPRFRGFQTGDPALGRTTLTLFDKQDRNIEFMIAAQRGTKGKLTQADVNRIIASLRPDWEIPREKDSQKGQAR